MWTTGFRKTTLLMLPFAFTVTCYFPLYKAALGNRLTLVHPALSWSPWLALLPLARGRFRTLKLRTASTTPKIRAQKSLS